MYFAIWNLIGFVLRRGIQVNESDLGMFFFNLKNNCFDEMQILEY